MTALRWTRRALDALLIAAIVAVALTAGLMLLGRAVGGQTLVIGGGSMEPTIGRGALVVDLPAPTDRLAVGDVVTVRQGDATPYTHRITRLADLRGEPYIETKGDANAEPDPAAVPAAAVIGRVAISVPLLGYLALVLATPLGLLGFLAVAAGVLATIWLLEELETIRCAICAAEAAALRGAAGAAHAIAAAEAGLVRATGDATHAITAAAAGIGHAVSVGLHHAGPQAAAAMPAVVAGTVGMAALAAARPPATARVRERGRARTDDTPVLSEADRRNPRLYRRRLAQANEAARASVATWAAAAVPADAESAAGASASADAAAFDPSTGDLAA